MSEGKIIRCCVDCIFSDDCTRLKDLAEHDKKVRAEAIKINFNKLSEHCVLLKMERVLNAGRTGRSVA